MSKERLYEEFLKKLQVIRFDLLNHGHSRANREFFWVSVPSGSINGHDTYKVIDLAKEFPKDLEDFATKHNVKVYSTNDCWLFS